MLDTLEKTGSEQWDPFNYFLEYSMCIMYNFTLGYVLDGFPSLCEDWLSMADQLDLVKNLPLTPDFIINLKVGTSSLDCHPCLVVVLFDPQIGT